MIRLQRCAECGVSQYPPREVCVACLSDRLEWQSAESLGLVQFDAGPVAVCFLAEAVAPGDPVQVRIGADDLLEAA
jgi:uncharacterized OB-fold protein